MMNKVVYYNTWNAENSYHILKCRQETTHSLTRSPLGNSTQTNCSIISACRLFNCPQLKLPNAVAPTTCQCWC